MSLLVIFSESHWQCVRLGSFGWGTTCCIYT